MKGEFLTPLIVEEVDGEEWFLESPLVYRDEDGSIYTAPIGFKTDFASIPRGLWNFFPKTGKHNKAAVIHDFLCDTRPFDSPTVHAIFKRALKASGVNWVSRQLMWAAVRTFGPKF